MQEHFHKGKHVPWQTGQIEDSLTNENASDSISESGDAREQPSPRTAQFQLRLCPKLRESTCVPRGGKLGYTDNPLACL